MQAARAARESVRSYAQVRAWQRLCRSCDLRHHTQLCGSPSPSHPPGGYPSGGHPSRQQLRHGVRVRAGAREVAAAAAAIPSAVTVLAIVTVVPAVAVAATVACINSACAQQTRRHEAARAPCTSVRVAASAPGIRAAPPCVALRLARPGLPIQISPPLGPLCPHPSAH